MAVGGMVTNGGLREQEVRQIRIRVSRALLEDALNPITRDSDGRPDTVSGQLTAVSCQYGTFIPGPSGCALMGMVP